MSENLNVDQQRTIAVIDEALTSVERQREDLERMRRVAAQDGWTRFSARQHILSQPPACACVGGDNCCRIVVRVAEIMASLKTPS